MVRSRGVMLATLAALVATAQGAEAQGLPRYGRRPVQANAPRLMVANPYVFANADSAPSVAVAAGMRERMERVAGRDFLIIPDTIMNQALVQYGYAANAILTPQLAVTLAKNIQARFVVTSTMTKTEGNRYRVQSRLVGVSDDAGVAIADLQAPGQRVGDFGQKIADHLGAGLKSLDDARECMQLRQSNPAKAAEAAQKALKDFPESGLAHYCLGLLAVDKKADREEIIRHFEAAVQGDSLALVAWNQLAQQYQAKDDTAKTLGAFSQLLRVAPTNQKLREEIFRQFLAYGKPDLARNVADEGLALDPFNADLYDLKSNACLFASDFPCAVNALEQLYAIDSTKADTLFFTKIAVAASQQPDTARLAKWAGLGVRRFPDNAQLLGYLNQAYALQGKTDSSLAITRKLLALGGEDQIVPALAAAQGLIKGGRLDEAEEFIAFVEKQGDAQQKNQLALILVNATTPLLQDSTKNFPLAIKQSKRTVALAEPGSRAYGFGQFFLGTASFLQATTIDPEAEKQKSCDMAREEARLFDEAEVALTAGKAVSAQQATTYLGYVAQFKPRAASMIKAFCK